MIESFENKFHLFARNLESAVIFRKFLISAVFAILLIRGFLHLTGYFQLGSESIHIAHMLWGGMLMLTSLILLMGFLNNSSRHLAAVIAGLGFGAFIDELGKFITSDNDYFFKPTFAFIYLIFIGLYFLFEFIDEKIEPSEKEYKINALEIAKEVILHDLDVGERRKALSYLSKLDKNDLVVHEIKEMIDSIKPKPENNADIFERPLLFVREKYLLVVKRKRFARFMMFVFIVISLINLFESLKIISYVNGFWEIGLLLAAILSGFLVVVGVYHHRRKNTSRAYKFYRWSIIVNIFVTQFFQFYHEQLLALLGLMVSITIYTGLQFLIDNEEIDKS